MVIVELPIFTKKLLELMDDESYRELQEALVEQPDLGDLIQGSGGLRKVRWKLPPKGKRGGVRVIYYWWANEDQLLMLLVYTKNEQENLTKQQQSILADLVRQELDNG
jgi:hypothetical protein